MSSESAAAASTTGSAGAAANPGAPRQRARSLKTAACLLALVGASTSGCQLLMLPFQLVAGILGIALKLLPLVPLFIYEPVTPPTPQDLIDPQPEVRLATLDLLDQRLDSAAAISAALAAADEDAALAPLVPALGESLLARERPGYRLRGVVLVPADRIAEASDLDPLLAHFDAAGFSVEVGELVDGGAMATDDLLPPARLLEATRREGITLIAAAPIAHLDTQDSAPLFTGAAPLDLAVYQR